MECCHFWVSGDFVCYRSQVILVIIWSSIFLFLSYNVVCLSAQREHLLKMVSSLKNHLLFILLNQQSWWPLKGFLFWLFYSDFTAYWSFIITAHLCFVSIVSSYCFLLLGTFKLTIEFTEEYPNKPPTVRFISKMFHPNGKSGWLEI